MHPKLQHSKYLCDAKKIESFRSHYVQDMLFLSIFQDISKEYLNKFTAT